MSNPLPVNRPQLLALFAAVSRELGQGLRAVAGELAAWREHAATIPDDRLRVDALHALDNKRGHVDGAALFWTLPSHRDLGLLRVLVTYELIQDYLDELSERIALTGADDASGPFSALGDALDPDRPLNDYYRNLPWNDDNGYLVALVQACRHGVRALTSYRVVKPFLAREAERADVLHLNHCRDPQRRDAALRAWAIDTFDGDDHGLHWYELTAAASGWITTHALLALAAERDVSPGDVLTTHSAYFPHVALALTLLDSWADQADDATTDDHNYLTHYASPDRGVLQLCASIDRSARDVLALPHGERHAVLLACMIALYMSKDTARRDEARAATRRIVRAGGTLPRLLLPILRLWRICNSQTAAT